MTLDESGKERAGGKSAGKAVFPLQQLSPSEATRLVVQHLVNHSRSIRSRLKQSVGDRAP